MVRHRGAGGLRVRMRRERERRVKTVVWDWNGTLLDDVTACVRALNRMLVRRGVPPTDRTFYRAHFGFPVRPFYAQVGLDLAREDWDAICTDFHRFVAEEPDQHLRPDARTALEAVRAHGGRQVILSALRQDLLEASVRREGLSEFFAYVYGVDNLDGATKLARGRALTERLAQEGCRPEDLVFIGDTLHDAEVAASLGAMAVLVDGGHQTAERLRTSGCAVMPSLGAAVEHLFGSEPDFPCPTLF